MFPPRDDDSDSDNVNDAKEFITGEGLVSERGKGGDFERCSSFVRSASLFDSSSLVLLLTNDISCHSVYSLLF